MAAFGRRGRGGTVSPVLAFWQWWEAGGAATCAAALEGQRLHEVAAAITDRVRAIDPALEWEAGRVESSAYALTLSGAGDPALRRLTERWRRAAPGEVTGWVFRAARAADPAVAGARLERDGVTVEFADARVAIEADPGATRLGVRVFHPAFASMSEHARGSVMFRLLDAALGEDDIERWLGVIEAVPEPVGLDDIGALCNAVARLAARRPAQERWVLGQGELAGNPVVVRTQQWLRWLDRPLFDLNTRLTLGFTADGRGLPLAEEVLRLNGVEDVVLAGAGASAELVTVVTTGGARTLDLYSDSDDQDVTAALRALGKRIGAGVEQVADPGWRRARVMG